MIYNDIKRPYNGGKTVSGAYVRNSRANHRKRENGFLASAISQRHVSHGVQEQQPLKIHTLKVAFSTSCVLCLFMVMSGMKIERGTEHPNSYTPPNNLRNG